MVVWKLEYCCRISIFNLDMDFFVKEEQRYGRELFIDIIYRRRVYKEKNKRKGKNIFYKNS